MTEDPASGGGAGRKPRGWRRVLRILAWQLALLVFLVEVVLRFVPVPGFTPEVLDPPFLDSERHRRLEPHPYLVGAPKPGWSSLPKQKQASHNSFGLRGEEITLEKPEGVRRIVCLGGSSTYGNGPQSDGATWPARLQVLLNKRRPDVPVQVINGGAPSWSTFESLINFAFRMVEFEPDLVIVYHATNDAAYALWPNPTYDNSHFRAVWPVVRPSPLEEIFEHSMTYLIWRKYGTDYLDRREDLGFYGIRNYEANYEDPFGDGPFPRRGFENFERNLRSIVALVRAHGARVMIMTQANLPSNDNNYNTGRNKHRAIAELTEITKRVAVELAVPLLDAKPILEGRAAAQIAEAGKQTVFTNGVHLRNPGASLLAELIGEYILAEDLLP